MIYMAFAMYHEAQPFIKYLDLKRDPAYEKVQVFRSRKPEGGSGSELRAEAGRGSESEPRAEAGSGSESEPRAEAESGSKSRRQAEADRGSESEPRAEAGDGSESEPQAEADRGSESEPRAEADRSSEGEPRAEVCSGSESRLRAEADRSSEGEPRVESCRGSGSRPDQEPVLLFLTGTGSVHAAAVLAYVCARETPGEDDLLVNFGVCAGYTYADEEMPAAPKTPESQTLVSEPPAAATRQRAAESEARALAAADQRAAESEARVLEAPATAARQRAAESEAPATAASQRAAEHAEDLRLFRIRQIFELVSKRCFYPDMILRTGNLPEASLVTVPSVVQSMQGLPAVLADMEAAALYQAGQMFFAQHQMLFFKVIYDRPDLKDPGLFQMTRGQGSGTEKKSSAEEVRALCARCVPVLWEAIQAAAHGLYTMHHGRTETGWAGAKWTGADQEAVLAFGKKLRATQAMQDQLERLCRYMELCGIQIGPYLEHFCLAYEIGDGLSKKEGLRMLHLLEQKVQAGVGEEELTGTGALPEAETDSDPLQDSGPRQCAGLEQGAGLQQDARSQRDSGMRQDGGLRQGAGLRQDSGSRRDSGLRQDSGPRQDGGSRQGAGLEQGAGLLQDSGSRRDSGLRQDSEPRQDGRQMAGGAKDRAGIFSYIYVERGVRGDPAVTQILRHFPGARIIEIGHYKDLFNRKNQSFPIQKQEPALILARKEGTLIYPGARMCQSFSHAHFYYTSCVMNCLYDCEYCYLQGMYPSGNVVLFVNLEDIFAEVDRLLARHPVYLCISYDTDLLAMEGVTGYVRRWYEFAAKRENLTLEIRTKSGAFGQFLYGEGRHSQPLAPAKNVIFAWTFSPEVVRKGWEHQTAGLKMRIQSFRQAAQAGFPVRACFDPLIYVRNFEEEYADLIRQVFAEPVPVMDASVGTFRVSVPYFKQMRQQRPGSRILWYPYVCENGVYDYGQEMSAYMTGYVRDCLKEYLEEDKIFIWQPDTK